jgi:hypothetical protein
MALTVYFGNAFEFQFSIADFDKEINNFVEYYHLFWLKKKNFQWNYFFVCWSLQSKILVRNSLQRVHTVGLFIMATESWIFMLTTVRHVNGCNWQNNVRDWNYSVVKLMLLGT